MTDQDRRDLVLLASAINDIANQLLNLADPQQSEEAALPALRLIKTDPPEPTQ